MSVPLAGPCSYIKRCKRTRLPVDRFMSSNVGRRVAAGVVSVIPHYFVAVERESYNAPEDALRVRSKGVSTPAIVAGARGRRRGTRLQALSPSSMNASPEKVSRGSFVKNPDFNKKILVVDDESAILQTLRFNLERSGYTVVTATDGRTAIGIAQREQPDLIILDIMLPVLDGIEACKEIRKFSAVPIIMLTAKDQEIDKVLALELGADDYVTKPFALHEFLARVKARLRRQNASQLAHDEALELGDIVLDPSRQSLKVAGQPVALAPKEFALLRVLMENHGRVVTRQTLLDKVWGYDFEGEQQTVSVHIRWLREKIERDSRNPRHIITVRSRGYMFKE